MSEDSSDPRWIRIRSNDGFSFLIPKNAAVCSVMLKRMLESGFREVEENTLDLPILRAVVTEKVMEYLVFKAQFDKAGPKEDVPDFGERIPPELALEMLMASDYLGA